MRCWWCGVEPVDVHDVTALESPLRQLLPSWPAVTDHEHALEQPTAAQLEQSGHETLQLVLRLAHG